MLAVYSVGIDSALADGSSGGPANSTETFAAPSTAEPTTIPTTDPVEHPAAGALQVNVNDAGLVEIHVSDANVLDVLKMLSVQSQKNIVASKQVTGTVSANLYNLSIHEALDALLRSNGYAYVEKGNFIYVYGEKELADRQKSERALRTQIVRLNYIPVADLSAMIKPVLSSEGQIAATKDSGKGLSSGGEGASSGGEGDTGGNSYAGSDLLVITDYPENLDRITALIKEIDKRPQQVLVEATIMAATLSDNNSLGVDLSFLGGVNFDSLLSGGNTFSGLLSNSVLDSASSSSSTGGTGTTGGAGAIVNQGYAGFKSDSNGLQVGIVHKNLGAFITAVESVTNTTILANPKVLALDKQSAEVHVGSSFGYQTTTVTQTTSTQTVQYIDTGTKLTFRPFVGDDGYIRMEIHPEDSTGGLNASNLPFKTTTEVSTNIMVKDGNTIVIGGLFREQRDTTRGQVPGLGSIPLIGALFRNQQDNTVRQEIIILLTPHVIKDDSAYAALSQKDMDSMDQLRVGMRRGMMFFSRSRLAEIAFDNARKELEKPKPNRDLAMWHLNAATNLDPTLVEAVDLKQKVNGETLAEADDGSIRRLLRQAIAADQQASRTPATQPAGR